MRKSRKAWSAVVHDWQLRQLSRQGLRSAEIALIMGFSPRTVAYRKEKLGLPMFKPGPNKGGWPHVAERNAKIIEEYTKGVPMAALSVKYGVKRTNMYTIIAKAKVGKKE